MFMMGAAAGSAASYTPLRQGCKPRRRASGARPTARRVAVKPMLDKDCRPDTLVKLSIRLERAAP
jgi:hypothetical protein